MALTYQDAKLLIEARLHGVDFEETLTIAHLALFLHPGEIRNLQKTYRSQFPDSTIHPLENYKFGETSDDFLRVFLGVSVLSIMDYSPYEGANIVHDLNQPVPENLHSRFDAVIEAGSLEHIFNFPAAIANLMKMVKVGGSIFIAVPANNLCGHGFYQFSPEIMFRIFTQENGFEVKEVALYEDLYPSTHMTSSQSVYKVTDPEKVRIRVGLISKRPVTMMVEAKRIEEIDPFINPPMQSDYVELWEKDKANRSSTSNKSDSSGEDQVLESEDRAKHNSPIQVVKKMILWLIKRLPGPIRAKAYGYLEIRHFSLSNTLFYKKIDR